MILNIDELKAELMGGIFGVRASAIKILHKTSLGQKRDTCGFRLKNLINK